MSDRNDGHPSRASRALPGGEPDLESVIAAYLGERLVGRHVAVLGDASTAFASRIADTAGRRVYVFDPDRRRTSDAIARARGSRRSVRYEVLGGERLPADTTFDAVVIPNLSQITASTSFDAEAVLTLAERMLAPRGWVAVATRRVGSADEYARLFDVVSARFAVVQMLGAVPFRGVTVAAFGSEEAPAVAIDSTLAADPEEPIAYLAIGSHEPLAIDPYLVVQLPSAAFPAAAGTTEPPHDRSMADLRHELAASQREAKELRARANQATELEAVVALLRSEATAKPAADRRPSDAPPAGEIAAEIASLEARLVERAERVRALETEAREAERIGRELVNELTAARAAADVRREGPAVDNLASRCSELEADLQRARWQIEALERELGERSESSADVAKLEAALRSVEEQLQQARGTTVA